MTGYGAGSASWGARPQLVDPSIQAPAEHRPGQIGTHDREGWRTHSIPGDVCLGCSDVETGRWVPVNQCPAALALYEQERETL